MWFSSSAGVSTSLSSTKSTSNACSTSASAKWPMRTLAITGIVTVFMISRITLMDAMRATPPSLRMSDGTRSSAITAHAPAFSAIFACSAFVTSIITPPLSISARPTFTPHSFEPFLPLPLPFGFFASIFRLLSMRNSRRRLAAKIRIPSSFLFHLRLFDLLFPDHHEPPFAPREYLTLLVSNLSRHEKVSSVLLDLAPFYKNLFFHTHGFQVLDAQLRCHGASFAKPAHLAHRLIEQQRDDPAVRKSCSALIPVAQHEPAEDPPPDTVLFERQFHSADVRSAAAKALVRRVRLQSDNVAQSFASSPFLVLYFLNPIYFVYSIDSHQRNSAAFCPPNSPLPLAHLDFQHVRQSGHAARNFFFIQARKSQA